MIPIPYALDAVNFLAADVRNLFGPFVNVFLVTSRHWSQTDVGLVTTATGLLGIVFQTPIGAAIDIVRAKRGVIVLTMAAMALSGVIIFVAPTFWPIAIALSILAVAGDAFAPAVSALTLGLVTKDATAWPKLGVRPRRQYRDCASGRRGRLRLLAARCLSHDSRVRRLDLGGRARHSSGRNQPGPGERPFLQGEAQGTAAGYRILFETRPLMIFALCAMLFHFANAPLLPLVGQKLALQFPKEATAMMSFCMVAAQGVMLPIAILVGRNADSWGRRPIFLVAFAVLPIRASLYILSDNAFWLIGVQLLDGVGAGIYGALTPLVISDIMRGSGRFNLAQGAVATTMGIGPSVSALFAGETVDHFDYSVTFLALGAAAAVAFLVYFGFMPETREDHATQREGVAVALEGAAGE